MADVAHIVSQGSDPNADPTSVGVTRSNAMMAADNATQRIVLQPGIFRESRYTVYVFNVGTWAPVSANGSRGHEVRQPPLTPFIFIPVCPPGEKYIKCFSLPELVSQFRMEAMTENPLVHHDEGIKVAQSIINPQNLTGDQWKEVSSTLHEGCDLGKFGVFYSLNEKPTEEELAKAKARVEKTYRAEITRGRTLAQAGKLADIPEICHFAADYFGVSEGWHAPVSVPESCPNCGEPMKKGLAYHVNSTGTKCIIDWRRAHAAGAVKYDEVPEEFRWKKEKSSAGASAV